MTHNLMFALAALIAFMLINGAVFGLGAFVAWSTNPASWPLMWRVVIGGALVWLNWRWLQIVADGPDAL